LEIGGRGHQQQEQCHYFESEKYTTVNGASRDFLTPLLITTPCLRRFVSRF